MFVAEVSKKIPEYNAEYCIELAFNVNEIQIKSYDIKKDDFVFEDEHITHDEDEPFRSNPDPHILDRVKVKNLFRPLMSMNSFS